MFWRRVFALVLVGYFTGPLLQLEAQTLSRLSFFILAPAFVLNVISTATIQTDLAARMTLYIIAIDEDPQAENVIKTAGQLAQ